MFRNLFRKEKPRVFLGSLVIVPKGDEKRFLEGLDILQARNLDTNLLDNLKEIFILPPASQVDDPRDTDLVLDVMIPQYQSGEILDAELTPVFWRPHITVNARLSYLKSGKIKSTLSVQEKAGWGQFINRLMSWRTLFRLRSLYDEKDMELLLYKACHTLLLRMRKTI